MIKRSNASRKAVLVGAYPTDPREMQGYRYDSVISDAATRYFEAEDEQKRRYETRLATRSKVTLPTLKFLQKQD